MTIQELDGRIQLQYCGSIYVAGFSFSRTDDNFRFEAHNGMFDFIVSFGDITVVNMQIDTAEQLNAWLCRFI